MSDARLPTIRAEPLTAESFAAYGAVHDSPAPGRRVYLDAALANRRPVAAKASLSVAHIGARPARPLPLAVIERHPFSSQSFAPLDPGRYLVMVAEKDAAGAADLTRLRLFVGDASQSFTYGADVWHGPITPLDGPMRFAIMMFNDGTSGDEELIRYDAPFAYAAVA
jgi:ureidoglycolate lyase